MSFQEWEQEILADIKQKTGMAFRLLGGINTRDPVVSGAVLPVLATWVEHMGAETSLRRSVYALFHTKFAASWLKVLIRWWQDEPDGLPRESLTQCVALLVTCRNARDVWAAYQVRPPVSFRYLLLSKLAKCPEVSKEVVEEILKALDGGALTIGDLDYISKVEHPRVRAWFSQRVASTDRRISTLAVKVVATARKAMPDSLAKLTSGPDRKVELFSTECDVFQAATAIAEIARRFDITIPAVLCRAEFVPLLDVDTWYGARLSRRDRKPACLWFRLEDIDTVELVLTSGVVADQRSADRS